MHPIALAMGIFMLGATATLFGRWCYVALGVGGAVDDSGRRRREDPGPFVAKETASADTIEKRMGAARKQMHTDAGATAARSPRRRAPAGGDGAPASTEAPSAEAAETQSAETQPAETEPAEPETVDADAFDEDDREWSESMAA